MGVKCRSTTWHRIFEPQHLKPVPDRPPEARSMFVRGLAIQARPTLAIASAVLGWPSTELKVIAEGVENKEARWTSCFNAMRRGCSGYTSPSPCQRRSSPRFVAQQRLEPTEAVRETRQWLSDRLRGRCRPNRPRRPNPHFAFAGRETRQENASRLVLPVCAARRHGDFPHGFVRTSWSDRGGGGRG